MRVNGLYAKKKTLKNKSAMRRRNILYVVQKKPLCFKKVRNFSMKNQKWFFYAIAVIVVIFNATHSPLNIKIIFVVIEI